MKPRGLVPGSKKKKSASRRPRDARVPNRRRHCSQPPATLQPAPRLEQRSTAGPGKMAEHLFEDIFNVTRIDPDGKKFDRVNRIEAKSEQLDMYMQLDVATDVYPMHVGDKEEKPAPPLPSEIRNKEKRSEMYAKLKREKKAQKRKLGRERGQAAQRAAELGEEVPEKQVPRTIENTREPDETVCRPDDQELFAGNDADEFNAVLKQVVTPKVLITTCRFNSGRGPAFIKELMQVIPNAQYVNRGTYDLKKIVEYANNREFTSVMVVHTNRREPDALLIINLPEGPTAHFKLSKLVLRKDIKNHGNPTSHKPELVLNNFTTRLGHRVGRMIQSLFPQDPNFRGRRVVTFHNQRDYIFFRHHRYIFEEKEKKIVSKDKKSKGETKTEKQVNCRLQECGPRFTLKLLTLQHGTFDTKSGEYEWVHKPDLDTSRRRFFL